MTTRTLTPHPKGFHGDRHLLRLVDRLADRTRVFIETGSNVGSTLGYVARRFPAFECIACEPDAEAFAVAREHACSRPGVALHCERSQELLARLAKDHAALATLPLLGWLDAHGYGFEWPLREEVRFFTEKFARGYLLIDDFRVPHDARFGWDRYAGQSCEFEYVRDSIAPGAKWRLYYPAYSEHTSAWHPLRGWGLLQFTRGEEQLEPLERELASVCRYAETNIEEMQRAPIPAAGKLRIVIGPAHEGQTLVARHPRRVKKEERAMKSPGSTIYIGGNDQASGASGAGVANPAGSTAATSAAQGTSSAGAAGSTVPSSAAASSATVATLHAPATSSSPSKFAGSSAPDFDAAIAKLRGELRADPGSATKWNDLGVCLVHKNDGDGALVAFGEALRIDPAHADARANLRLVLDALYGNEGRPMPVAPGAWGCHPSRDPVEDLRQILGQKVRVIVDGGSHEGGSVARLRAAFPAATIHAFEPLTELAQGLRARFAEDRALVVHNAALAEEGGQLRMRLTGDASLSTLHEPSALERRCRNKDHAAVAERDVLAMPLGDAVQGEIDLLHLDLNGGEAAALLGAGERLHGVRSLLVRVALGQLHVGGPVFSDLDVYLRAQGFRLFHLYNLWCHADGQVTSAAALYTNARYFS